MSKEKQIEEITEIIRPFVSGLACEEESGSCEFVNCQYCRARDIARKIYGKGYRKQSEGEWKQAYNSFPRYVCTNCNHLYNNKEYKYCPNCGARMKGGGE